MSIHPSAGQHLLSTVVTLSGSKCCRWSLRVVKRPRGKKETRLTHSRTWLPQSQTEPVTQKQVFHTIGFQTNCIQITALKSRVRLDFYGYAGTFLWTRSCDKSYGSLCMWTLGSQAFAWLILSEMGKMLKTMSANFFYDLYLFIEFL